MKYYRILRGQLTNLLWPHNLRSRASNKLLFSEDDLIFFGSTKIDPISIENLITAEFGQSLGFQAVLDEVGGRDRLTIRLEMQAEMSDVEAKARNFLDSLSRITEDVAYIIQAKLVHEPMIEIVPQGCLEHRGDRKTPRLIERRSR